jgi:hypothetical protein
MRVAIIARLAAANLFLVVPLDLPASQLPGADDIDKATEAAVPCDIRNNSTVRPAGQIESGSNAAV